MGLRYFLAEHAIASMARSFDLQDTAFDRLPSSITRSVLRVVIMRRCISVFDGINVEEREIGGELML